MPGSTTETQPEHESLGTFVTDPRLQAVLENWDEFGATTVRVSSAFVEFALTEGIRQPLSYNGFEGWAREVLEGEPTWSAEKSLPGANNTFTQQDYRLRWDAAEALAGWVETEAMFAGNQFEKGRIAGGHRAGIAIRKRLAQVSKHPVYRGVGVNGTHARPYTGWAHGGQRFLCRRHAPLANFAGDSPVPVVFFPVHTVARQRNITLWEPTEISLEWLR